MAPSATEAVFALGAGDRVVGVDSYSDFPPAARDLPRVGGLTDPDLETILALEPDLILVWMRHEKVEALGARYDIPTLALPMNRLDEIYAGFRRLAEVLGVPERGEALCREIAADLQSVRDRVTGRPRVRTLFLAGRTLGVMKGLWAAGNDSFLTDLLEIAGGRNVFDDMDDAFREVAVESIVARAPEAVIEPHPGAEDAEAVRRKSLDDWRKLPTIPAVRHGRVLILTGRGALLPGPRIGETAARLADLLHPETAHHGAAAP
jgi:iron complex transport system substrate-binding protein